MSEGETLSWENRNPVKTKKSPTRKTDETRTKGLPASYKFTGSQRKTRETGDDNYEGSRKVFTLFHFVVTNPPR